MAEISLSPSAIIEQFKKNDVTHIVWLPDTETNFMYNQIISDEDLKLVPICREGESMPIAAGLWIGGKKPVVLIQNTGMFEAGDSIRGMGIDLGIPMVMVVGYRGWMGEGGQMTDSAGVFTEPILDAWGIRHYMVETDDDVARISEAFEDAEENQTLVACLLGAEYG
ncbi:MAG: hypothetical protein F4Y49_06525 [Dehalococcoidia bacterium]|nr:hypothetical protein [Dehalococcoidia bacterium]